MAGLIDPSVIDKVDPQFVEIYNKYQAPNLRADQVPYEVYNADRAKYTFPTHLVRAPVPEVGSATIYKVPVSDPPGEIRVEVYVPTEDAIAKGGLKNEAGLPAHIDIHGGGFVIGNLEADRAWCMKMCQQVGMTTMNTEYRTAPEYPHPVPAMDCWTVLKWTFANAAKLGIDPSRVGVGGLSAGGNLAAVCALLARDEPGMPPLKLQLLIVPCLDARYMPQEGSCDPKTTPYESYIKNEFAPCLPLNRMRWFYNLWLGRDVEERKKKAEHFLASPMVAESHANLAPASFHIAEIDTLTSEGIAYHEKLKAAGNSTDITIYKGVGHPFGHWDGELKAAADFVQNCATVMKKAYKL